MLNILKMYSIFVPHVTEHIYQEFFRRFEKEKSIHRTIWAKPSSIDKRLIRFGESVKEAIYEARKYKTEHNLSMREEIDEMSIRVEPDLVEWVRKSEKDLLACSRAKKLNV